jgi:anti-sigma B factor antagonist
MSNEDDFCEEFSLRLRVEGEGTEHPTVLATGEIDLVSGDRFRRCLQSCVDGGGLQIAVDMSGVSFVDSSGLKALIMTKNSLPATGRLVVRNPSPVVRSLLSLSGIDQVLAVEPAPADQGRHP